MERCKNCNAELVPNSTFCKHCGARVLDVHPPAPAPQQGNPTALLVLCILTIVGSLFGMFRGWFYELIATAASNDQYWRGGAFILLNMGTLLGAIMMLLKKLNGLYIYTLAQSMYLLMVLYTTFIYTDPGNTWEGPFAVLISMIFIVPSAAFLIVYWLPSIRSVLSK